MTSYIVGCDRKEDTMKPPAGADPFIYGTWVNMRQRCRNPNVPNYKDYGGRGIKVCLRWDDYLVFASDMGERPEGMSLERVDVNGDYEPDNCVWATRKTQNRNMRTTRMVTIEGVEYKAADLADIAGVKTDTIIGRAERGFSYEEVVGSKRLSNLKGIRLAVKARSKKFREATHCQKGHEFTPDNTYLTKEGWKRCRVCIREKEARYSDKKMEYKRAWRARRKSEGIVFS